MKSAEAKSLIKKAARGEKWRTIQTIPKGAKKQPAAKPQKKKVKAAAKEPEPPKKAPKADEAAHEHAAAIVSLAAVDDASASATGRFFAHQRWGEYSAERKELTLSDAGLDVVERCPAFGVCLSYRPMLNLLAEAAYGTTAEVFR